MSRYIDADEHLQKLGERRDTAIIWELNCNDEATKDRAQEAILIFNECISELINAPTADVRENVNGEWGRTKNGFIYCSNCEATWYDNAWTDNWHYCPNCGADMRGET